MGLCHNPPRLEDNFSEDNLKVGIDVAQPSVKKNHRRFSVLGKPSSTKRNSRPNHSKSLVTHNHKETLKKCHGILHDLAQCTARGKNWNQLINQIISNLEAIKLKTAAQEASDQAKELLFAALTKGSQEDKEIGNHFRQLTNMMRGDTSWRGSSSTCCRRRVVSVPVVKSWLLQPKVVECSGFREKIVTPDISLMEKNNPDKNHSKEISSFFGKQRKTDHASPPVIFSKYKPATYMQQFPTLKNIYSWNFDLFGFSVETSNRPLSTMFLYICSEMKIDTAIVGINISKLSSFIQEVESSYGDNPYHNKLHGADVVHSSFNFLQTIFLQRNLDLVHRFTLLFASAVHDFCHPGVGNDFLVNTGSPIATTYNDTSVLENWHTSQAFSLLRKPEFNFLEHVEARIKAIIRGNTIQAVLMTDMKRHGEHVKQLQQCIEQRVSASELVDPPKLISYALHVSDLSHPTKRFAIHKEWSKRLSKEFLDQGDRELELGMEPGALFDRRKVNMEKGQIGFIDFIILPLWINWTTFIGADEEWINQINLNKEEWQRRAGLESQETESRSSSPSELEFEENKAPDICLKAPQSAMGNVQKSKLHEQRKPDGKQSCWTSNSAKHQDEIYSLVYGNEMANFVTIEEAAFTSKERKKPDLNVPSSLHPRLEIKTSSSQKMSMSQAIEKDGIPMMPKLETKLSSKLLCRSNSAYSVGVNGDCYIQQSREFVIDPSISKLQSSQGSTVKNPTSSYEFSKLEFSLTTGSSKKLDWAN